MYKPKIYKHNANTTHTFITTVKKGVEEHTDAALKSYEVQVKSIHDETSIKASKMCILYSTFTTEA